VSVTAERFGVEMNSGLDSFNVVGFDAQHYVARIGSYVLVPLQSSYVVSEVVGLRERDSGTAAPTRENEPFEFPKFLDVVPIGTLPFKTEEQFRFGVSVFPPLYADVLYVESQDLDRIFDVTNSVEVLTTSPLAISRIRAFDIGTSVVFDDYSVKVRVNEFFGGHSGILGNTGSGKSCTVAAILQSILGKQDDHRAIASSFLIMDTNGEYKQAFDELETPIRKLLVEVPGRAGAESSGLERSDHETSCRLRLPHWFLSPEEWELLLRASERAQRPVLRTALGITSLMNQKDTQSAAFKNHVMATAIQSILATSESPTSSAGHIRGLVGAFSTDAFTVATLGSSLDVNFGKFVDGGVAIEALVNRNIMSDVNLPDYDNTPFEFDVLGEAIELAILYEEAHGNRHIRDYCSTLLTRFKSIRDRGEFEFMRPSVDGLMEYEQSAENFVNLLLGLESKHGSKMIKASQVTIIDMNAVEDEIVQVIAAVVSRLIFERLRQSVHRNSFPVNLILEEAHRYIPERPTDFALDAVGIFERIAKEGRKYGLFLMVASQRPSELSRTVLSQCSNFIVHRIQNPEDLQNIRRMTPFISESVLSRLPSLPKQHALIFGNAVNVPTTFRVRDAIPTPRSEDAAIADLWFQAVGTPIDV
jgi:DNA helicase HerA-like ATPase